MREAEFAMVISDRWQCQGLGTELLKRLVETGKAQGLERIEAYILPQNGAMQRVSRKLGFELLASEQPGGMVRAVKRLS